jgi:hypothetical protein
MMVSQSMREGTKLAMGDALVAELAELNKRLTRYKMDAPLYRCVITATIGCDTLPGGVYGLGAKQLHVLIDGQKPIDANALVDIVIAAKKGRVMEDELRVVIDALMHESCNTIECSTQEKGHHQTFSQVSGQTLAELQEIYDKVLVQTALELRCKCEFPNRFTHGQ